MGVAGCRFPEDGGATPIFEQLSTNNGGLESCCARFNGSPGGQPLDRAIAKSDFKIVKELYSRNRRSIIATMTAVSSEITHVSDTALLVAAARATECERPDAFVRDRFAARLAGERGMAMFRALPNPDMMCFGMAMRTKFLDELLLEALMSTGIKTGISVGSGLDTRPWRLELPPDLRWIEVDFPAMLDYKEKLMATETPRCRRERLSADLNDPVQCRAIYAAVGGAPALMITEGLLMYLPAGTVEALATEACRQSGIRHWISDIMTSSFSKAVGGDRRHLCNVQADDCLEGEKILETIFRNGWRTAARRSYITDLAFAAERIGRMMRGRPQPAPPAPFAPDDPSGVHRFSRAIGDALILGE
jgi:methyltransferase (TIGR00027 family)